MDGLDVCNEKGIFSEITAILTKDNVKEIEDLNKIIAQT